MTDQPPLVERTFDVSTRLSPADGRVAAAAVEVHAHAPEHPPAVKLLVSNLTDVPRQFAFGMSPPFTRRTLTRSDGDASAELDGASDRPDEDAALVVVPGPGNDERYGNEYVDRFVPDGPVDGCWRASEVPGRMDGGTLTALEPGAGVFRTFYLLDHPDNQSCLPRGRYAGGKSFRVGESRFDQQSGHPELEYELELVVEVE